MSPGKKKANTFKRLASQLQKDINTVLKLSEQAQEFADKMQENEINHKNPNIYAVAMSLQYFYTALETGFKRVAKDIDGELPEGGNWHSDLLDQMALKIEEVRPAFISSHLKDKLDRLRRFRHIIRYGYEYELDWSQMKPLVESLNNIVSQLKKDVEQFKSFLMKLAAEIEDE